MVSLKQVAPTIRARRTAPQAAQGNPAMQALQEVIRQQVIWRQATGSDVERDR
jgi:hypothetical protein